MAKSLSRRRLLGAAPLLAAGGALLAGCDLEPPKPGPPSPGDRPTNGVSGERAAPTPRAAATGAPVAESDLHARQTLRLAGWALPSSLEPAKEGGPLRVMTQNTFRPPFYLDQDGNLRPGVCASWDVSTDGLVYRLRLDPHARFSDGSTVTAADLKWSWEHLSHPRTKAWSASYVAGPILGYQEFIQGQANDIRGLVALDDETIEITLATPYGPFIRGLATYIAGVVKKSNVESGPLWEDNPVCCGPYRVESWNRTTGEITWVPNPYWWGERPRIERVTYTYVRDASAQLAMFDNDEVDIMQPTDLLAAQMLKGKHAAHLFPIPYGGLYFYYFRVDRAPMEDPNVRRALLQATDMGKAVQAVFGDGQTAAYGIIPPTLEGYRNPRPYFSPTQAREALAASTYRTADNLPPISIAVGTNLPEYVRLSEHVQRMWQDVLGVKATVVPLGGTADARVQGAQVFRASLGTIIHDASAAVSALGLSSSNSMRQNVGARHDALDALLAKADALPLSRQNERITLYQQAEKVLLEEAYYVPIIWVQYYYAVKPWVKNYAANNDLSLCTLPRMYIAARQGRLVSVV